MVRKKSSFTAEYGELDRGSGSVYNEPQSSKRPRFGTSTRKRSEMLRSSQHYNELGQDIVKRVSFEERFSKDFLQLRKMAKCDQMTKQAVKLRKDTREIKNPVEEVELTLDGKVSQKTKFGRVVGVEFETPLETLASQIDCFYPEEFFVIGMMHSRSTKFIDVKNELAHPLSARIILRNENILKMEDLKGRFFKFLDEENGEMRNLYLKDINQQEKKFIFKTIIENGKFYLSIFVSS